jgi:hypothetical protein
VKDDTPRCGNCALPSTCEIYQTQGDGGGRLPPPCGGGLWQPRQTRARGRYRMFALYNPESQDPLPGDRKRSGPMPLSELDDK